MRRGRQARAYVFRGKEEMGGGGSQPLFFPPLRGHGKRVPEKEGEKAFRIVIFL